jgi:hypothetical protein
MAPEHFRLPAGFEGPQARTPAAAAAKSVTGLRSLSKGKERLGRKLERSGQGTYQPAQ